MKSRSIIITVFLIGCVYLGFGQVEDPTNYMRTDLISPSPSRRSVN